MSAGQVFAPFDESKVGILRLWVDSWAARGWSPRLLSPNEIRDAGGSAKKAVARRAGNALLLDLGVINFSHNCSSRLRVVAAGRRGWKAATLVRFPAGATPDDILNCGRKLCLS